MPGSTMSEYILHPITSLLKRGTSTIFQQTGDAHGTLLESGKYSHANQPRKPEVRLFLFYYASTLPNLYFLVFLLLKRRFAQEFGQNHRGIVQNVYFRWTASLKLETGRDG